MRRFLFRLTPVILLPVAAIGAETQTLTYDARGRLVQIDHSGPVNANVQQLYRFDAADNRVQFEVKGAPGPGPVSGAVVIPVSGYYVIPLFAGPM